MNYKLCRLKDIFKSKLPQALLAKAFSGELVEQLPTDGDARELLKQIKLAKSRVGKRGKNKKDESGG